MKRAFAPTCPRQLQLELDHRLPDQPAPVQRDPFQPLPVQREPSQVMPVQRDPVQRDPAQSVPVQVALVQRDPDQPSPVQREPFQIPPVQDLLLACSVAIAALSKVCPKMSFCPVRATPLEVT